MNVIELKEKPKEKVSRPKGFEVMLAVKRTRGDYNRDDSDEEEETLREPREPQREIGETSKKHKRSKKPRQNITIPDFPLGKGHESYSF